MATIHKKTWRDLFEKVLSGEKKFDVRLADFAIATGDVLVLDEWDEEKQAYTGRKIEARVSFVLKTKELNFWSQQDIDGYGYHIIQLDEQTHLP